MNFYLINHDCRYAAEQSMLTLFPEERPRYPEGPPPKGPLREGEPLCAVLSMTQGEQYTVCSCRLRTPEGDFFGRAAVKTASMGDKLSAERAKNRIVKQSFFRAALRAGVPQPEWGSLTGVRPVKLLSAFIEQGLGERAALSAFRREYGVSAKRAALALPAARASLEAAASLGPRDVCLYVGIPFCPTRCAYCSFVSQSVEKSMKLIEPFLTALFADIEKTARAVNAAGLRPVALYMGGGTPTTLSAAQLDALCAKLAECFDLRFLREYCVEAGRPDTITEEKLRVLRSHGVDRISVNPQTMSDSVLEAIGRRHTAEDIVRALALTKEVGGFAVNMDLIAGLPADRAEIFRETLRAVLALSPENITVHTLARKKGSRLNAEGGALPGSAEVSEMLDDSFAALGSAGYEPYYLYRQKFMSGGFENVGWTRPGFVNLYNICIMEELCGIISMGAGGSTKLVGESGRILRFFAPKYPLEYINGAEKLRADKQKIEEFYNGI